MKNQIIEIFGWGCAVAILGAYAAVSFGTISSSSIAYQILNLTGSIGIGLVSLRKKDYQPAALNIIWGAIALVALIKIFI